MRRSLLFASCLLTSAIAIANATEVSSYSKNLDSEVVVKQAIAPEAITLSDSGNRLIFIAKETRDFAQTPPTTAWSIQKDGDRWSAPKLLPWGGMVTSVSFGKADQWLVVTNSHGTFSGYKTILKNLFGDREKIGDLIGFEHRIEIYDSANAKKLIHSFTPADMGLKKPEMLKHARVSPDGKWMTFYTHGYEDQRGIYVYNFESKQTIHLGLTDDKHPTWTPDGSKILFHQQEGGNAFVNGGGVEKSVLGYYELRYGSQNSVTSDRKLMDTVVGAFHYYKHPSVYPNTDLVFFHGMTDAESSKKLFVRRLGVDSKIFKISDLMIGEAELKGTKHANSSLGANGLFFVGREKGKPDTLIIKADPYSEHSQEIEIIDIKDIYSVSHKDVMKIQKFVLENDAN